MDVYYKLTVQSLENSTKQVEYLYCIKRYIFVRNLDYDIWHVSVTLTLYQLAAIYSPHIVSITIVNIYGELFQKGIEQKG